MGKLAIVIPAYKAKFLGHALRSIQQQTCRTFCLYIGDDYGPPDIEHTVNMFSESLPLTYHRFSENAGLHCLTKQWDRCIKMSSEPWVWLFSDDDVMEPDCVHAFYSALAKTKPTYDIYRFNTTIIDEHNTITGICPPLPEHEMWPEFLYCMLRGWRTSPVQSLVFSREAYERVGGFLNLPGGWGCDEAMQIALAGHKGIGLISGPRIHFRQSTENISSMSNGRTHLYQRSAAQLTLLSWCIQKLTEKSETEISFGKAPLVSAIKHYFREILPNIIRSGNSQLFIQSYEFARHTWPESLSQTALIFLSASLEAFQNEVRIATKRLFRLASP